MTKYQKYAEYKDSGVEWLGEIPKHWDSKPLKYLCTYNDDVLPETTAKDVEIQYIDIGSISAVDGISHIEEMIFKDAPSRASRIVKDGDVIVSTVRTYLEAIAPIDNPPENLIVSTGFAVIRPNQYLYKGFAAYCLRAKGFIKEVVARSVGVSYPAINSSELVGITIPSVEYSEQVKIANFLDHETAQIDSLIEKQQQLIQLLKEKRQAVISHAVTKGLNPNVSMKDSGVEWLGEVPEHWEIKRVRHAFDINNNLRTPINGQARLEMDGDFRYYGPTGVLNLINRYNVEGEYFLLGEDGDHFLKFKEQPMTIYVEGNFNVNNHAHLIKGKGLCSTKWGCLYFEHKDLFPWLIKQGVGRYKLQKTVLLDIPVAIPSLDEQEFILSEVNKKKNYFSDIEKRTEDLINFLKERRITLISAAVTGKIDVRHWQHPNKNNEPKMEFGA